MSKYKNLKVILFIIGFVGIVNVKGQINNYTITNPQMGNIKSIHFFNDHIGVTSEDSVIHFTTDGGQTWQHRYMPNMVSGAVAVSIQGNDTLFVVAEGKYHRIQYFHGFRDSAILLNSWSGQSYNEYPTIAFNGQNLIVAGNYIDTVTGYSGFYRSTDHGISWAFKSTNVNYGNISTVSHRQADTFLMGDVGTSVAPYYHEIFAGHGYYWLKNGLYRYLHPNSFMRQMGRYDCMDNTCIGYTGSKVRVHKGPIIRRDASLMELAEISHLNKKDVRISMNSHDEFITVYPDDSIKYLFHISAYQFKWLYPVSGPYPTAAVVTDSAYYSFVDSSATAEVPGGICRSDNYIYFTLAPKIYRISTASIGIDFNDYKRELPLSFGYGSSGNSLFFFNMKEQSSYQYEIFNVSGQLVSRNQLPNDGIVTIRDLNPGLHVMRIYDDKGTSGVYKIVK